MNIMLLHPYFYLLHIFCVTSTVLVVTASLITSEDKMLFANPLQIINKDVMFLEGLNKLL